MPHSVEGGRNERGTRGHRARGRGSARARGRGGGRAGGHRPRTGRGRGGGGRMSWRLAKALEELRGEVNAKWPNRDKSSDGSVGDLSHQARKSDPNPNSAGVVR